MLLTDAELDHTLGLLLLREAQALEVHATPAVHETLRAGTGVLATLERYCRGGLASGHAGGGRVPR